jgi:hypothetical protein
VTTQRDFLARIADELRQADIPYMVTGSLSSAHYGEPRSTNDIDIVINPTAEGLQRLVELLSSSGDYYISRQSAEQALSNRSMFNVIDFSSGWKADFIICKDREFSRTEFARRHDAELLGIPVQIASAEDVILSKLEWARISESDRPIRDAESIVSTLADQLDLAYLRRWAKELEVLELFRQITPNQ